MLFSSVLFFVAATFKIGFSATASFYSSDSGIDGTVTVDDRFISINLDFSALDHSMLPGGASCFADGLYYHIHESWDYPNSTGRVGSSACSTAHVGRHYDPYLACGPYSGNMYCETYTTDECVTSSSAFDSNNVYACNSSNYEMNPYVCEVGDWSGKYGTLYVSDNMTSLFASSYWEVKSMDVQGKSVVFHCANTNAKAFCAQFDNSTDTMDNEIMQPVADYYASVFAIIAYGQFPIGVFGFNANGTYFGNVLGQVFNDQCQNVVYRIYDSWDSNDLYCLGESDCKDAVGMAWDPTVSCEYGSDSEFCNYADYRLCNDSSYTYSCDYSNDRYSCAPGDLSGKYGTIDTSSNSTYFVWGSDDLLPPLDMMNGKSIVFECADHSEILAGGLIFSTEYLYYNTSLYYNYTWLFNSSLFSFNSSFWMYNSSYWDNFSWNMTMNITIMNITWNGSMTTTSAEAGETTSSSMKTTSSSGTTSSVETTSTSTSSSSEGYIQSISCMVFGIIGLAWWQL